MSIAGGFYKAVEAAHRTGCDCVQLFTAAPQQWPFRAVKAGVQSDEVSTKNNNQWRAKELTDDDCTRFQTSLKELKIKHPIAHDSYLINLGSPDDELWKKSVDAMVVELQRADALGIPYVVAHPGAFTTTSEKVGIRRIARGLNEVHKQTRKVAAQVLLETTAGQGSNLGWRFEHLAEIIEKTKDPDRLGVCFDTCHVFAAGYAMETKKEYLATIRAADKAFGYKLIKAFHVNDSKKPLGSRVDRHAHIGEGEMGLEPFRHLMNDRRFRRVPMYLETPKGTSDAGEELDVMNLRTLRGLVASK